MMDFRNVTSILLELIAQSGSGTDFNHTSADSTAASDILLLYNLTALLMKGAASGISNNNTNNESSFIWNTLNTLLEKEDFWSEITANRRLGYVTSTVLIVIYVISLINK